MGNMSKTGPKKMDAEATMLSQRWLTTRLMHIIQVLKQKANRQRTERPKRSDENKVIVVSNGESLVK